MDERSHLLASIVAACDDARETWLSAMVMFRDGGLSMHQSYKRDLRRKKIAERRMLTAELLRDYIRLDEISLPGLADLAAYIDVLVYTDWVADPNAAHFGAAYAEAKESRRRSHEGGEGGNR